MRLPLAMLAVASCALLWAPAAHASWADGAEIVSASLSRLEQGDGATQYAAISQDGRYVAFQTRARNLYGPGDPGYESYTGGGGIFRRDLTTGKLELVADGADARNPSSSADGRFVAFASPRALVAGDANGKLDAYVRDMNVPIASAGAFELVSARDGGDVAATYADPFTTVTGAEVTRGPTISADGTTVVFRTTDASDLPDHASADVEAFQVFVRDRVRKTTTLVTRSTTTGAPAAGGTGPAVLSADGTTVVWPGRNANLQTPFMQGEAASDTDAFYLWRRVADGPGAPTRRITGEVDFDDPGCPQPGAIVPNATATGPCYGPLTVPEGSSLSGIGTQIPAVSADGRRVAFLTGSGPRPNDNTGGGLDAYVADMSPGVSRKSGTTELTRDAFVAVPETGSPLQGVALSANGRHLALVTPRISFLLPAPLFVGAPSEQFDHAEIYVVDLERFEIERAVRAAGGGEVNGSATRELSLSGDGGRLAFVSAATNLFPGDSNEAADAFVATRTAAATPPQAAGEDVFALADGGRTPASARARLSLRVKRLRGAVRLTVRVPGPGVLETRTLAGVPMRKGRGSGRVWTRTLASGRIRTLASGDQTAVIRPAGGYRRLLRRRGRLAATLSVSFSPASGAPRLRAERAIVFKR